MADTTIVNLPAGPAVPDDADLMEGVDVSDTTNNATGENVKWTIAELRAAMGGGGSEVLIQEITDPAGGEFSFAIPAGYDRVYIKGNIRCSGAGDTLRYRAQVNGDTTTGGYYYQMLYATNDALDERGANNWNAYVCAANATAGAHSKIDIVIEDPDSTTVMNAVSSLVSTPGVTGTTGFMVSQNVTRQPSVAAMTLLELIPESGNLTGKLQLIGNKVVAA